MSYTTFMKAAALAGVTNVSVIDSGMLSVNLMGDQMRLVPVDSLLFRDITSGETVAFRADGDRITHAFVGSVPMMAFEKRTGLATPNVHLVVLGVGLLVFLLTAGAAVVRRFTPRERRPLPLPGRVFIVGLSVAFLLGAIGLAMSVSKVDDLLYNRLTKLNIALALPVIGAIFTLSALIAAFQQWRAGSGSRWERLRYSGVVLVAVLFIWSLNSWNLLGWRM